MGRSSVQLPGKNQSRNNERLSGPRAAFAGPVRILATEPLLKRQKISRDRLLCGGEFNLITITVDSA